MGGGGRSLRGIVFAFVALAAGCGGAALPRLDRAVPARWRHAEPPPGAAVDLRGWWRAYGDAQLDELVDDALRSNLQVAAADERLLAARALYRSDAVHYLPRLRAKTEDAIDPDASASFFVAGFDATWELGLFGRATATGRQARGTLAASAADLQQARVSLVAEVVRDWLALRAAQQRAVILAEARDLRARQLALVRVRVGLRLAAADAEARAAAAVEQATQALAEPQAEADRAAQQLAVLLGRTEPDPAWLAPAPLPALGPLRIAQAPADLLRSRPDVARAEAEVLRAAGDAGVARADLYPRIDLGGSLVWSTNITTHRRTDDNAIASAGPGIDIPLFDWGARHAEWQASRHTLAAAVDSYRQTVLEGVAEAETALGELERGRTGEASAVRAEADLARADRAVATRQRLHLASSLDRLDSRLALAEAALARNQAVAAHDLALVSLFKALGGAPLPADGAPAGPDEAP